MQRNFIIITSLLFTVLMLIKGAGALLPASLLSTQVLFCTELEDMEKEQESKGKDTTGSHSTEELFDHAAFPLVCLANTQNAISLTENKTGALPDGYFDTLTPPPNRSCC